MKIFRLSLIALLVLLAHPALALSDFFEIKDIQIRKKPDRDGEGIWIPAIPKENKPAVFVPCVEVKLMARESVRGLKTVMRAHFFDESKKLVSTASRPSDSLHANGDNYAAPVIFPGNTPEKVYFPIPKALEGKTWSVVIVFGDIQETVAKIYPGTSFFGFEFPGKDQALAAAKPGIKRPVILDPVIEQTVKTYNVAHPQITLFLRPPTTVDEMSEVKGVMALCVLAPNIDGIRRRLQSMDPAECEGLLAFADRHKLAILCWGAQTLWRPDASYDELERETARELDRNFDQMADAWDRGVSQFVSKYGLPSKEYLLWGVCASGQWAHRLALRKPDRFLATYIHIPSSFDKPTPDGAKILWLLTTGELDGGYQRAIRWYKDCRSAGYPMIYKPIIGLGHGSSPIATNLGMRFFEYALTLRGQRREVDAHWPEILEKQKQGEAPQPWPAEFRDPEFFGDFLNQKVVPRDQKNRIPEALRVALPNKILSEAWDK